MADFEAWNYGPVIRSVYEDRKLKLGKKKHQDMAKAFNVNIAFVGNEIKQGENL